MQNVNLTLIFCYLRMQELFRVLLTSLLLIFAPEVL